MKQLRCKSLVRNPRFAIDTPEILFGGALLVLTLLKAAGTALRLYDID